MQKENKVEHIGKRGVHIPKTRKGVRGEKLKNTRTGGSINQNEKTSEKGGVRQVQKKRGKMVRAKRKHTEMR